MTQGFLDALSNYDTALPSDIELLEDLTPFKPDIKKLEMSQAANTEYPFFAFVPGAPPNHTFQLFAPDTYYTSTDSLKHFRTAYRLMAAIQTLSPEVRTWRIHLCRSL